MAFYEDQEISQSLFCFDDSSIVALVFFSLYLCKEV
jgi:hypothetical protein